VDVIMRKTNDALPLWHPVLPIGISHATSEDDVYQEHYIPQRMVIIPSMYMGDVAP